MHIHILGICGTFMGSLARLAKDMGHHVTGSDENVYPPMSDQLADAGIPIMQGFDASHLSPAPDLVVIGNAMSRGNPAVEHVLNSGLRYTSGPQMLAEVVLPGRWVVAVAGTHGKTTTTSMVAWILEDCGLNPGFLIGGVPGNFPVSARLGEAPFFCVEADEYDTAFFDKRSKFLHYRARTVILNNLEYDHADIFPDLAAIQRQFHHLVRTVPGNGRIILPTNETALEETLAQGCWTEVERFGEGAGFSVELISEDGSAFRVLEDGQVRGEVHWEMTGEHSVKNGMAAILAARHCGVTLSDGCDSLSRFRGVKRRMEVIGRVDGITVYDDFAHHPTAIATTLQGLRRHAGDERIIAVIEPRSNTMRMGVHQARLPDSVRDADAVIWFQPDSADTDLADVAARSVTPSQVLSSTELIIKTLCAEAGPCHIVIMSNGGFGGIHQKLVESLKAR